MVILGIALSVIAGLGWLVAAIVSPAIRHSSGEVLGAIYHIVDAVQVEVRILLSGGNPQLANRLTTIGQRFNRLRARVRMIAITAVVVPIVVILVTVGFLFYGSQTAQKTTIVMLAFSAVAGLSIYNTLKTTIGLGTAKKTGLLTLYLLFLAAACLDGWWATPSFKSVIVKVTIVGTAIWIMGMLMKRTTLAAQWTITIAIILLVLGPLSADAFAAYAPAQHRWIMAKLHLNNTNTNLAAAQTQDEADRRYARVKIAPTQVWKGTADEDVKTLKGERAKITIKVDGVDKEVNRTLKPGTVFLLANADATEIYTLLDSNDNKTPIKLVKGYELDEVGELLEDADPIYIDIGRQEPIDRNAALVAFTPTPTPAPRVEQAKQAPAVQVQQPAAVVETPVAIQTVPNTPTASSSTRVGNRITIVLLAKDKWFDTGVDLGTHYRITVDTNKRWSNGGETIRYFDANGFPGILIPGTLAPTTPLGRLIADIGGQVKEVGLSTIEGRIAGRLKLSMNDKEGQFNDNLGYVVVTVELLDQ